MTEDRVVHRDFYGIAEIADALGLGRPLVTAWRRRRSHGMPEPDAELASGPIWLGRTVEPWIERVRERADREAPPPVTEELGLRVLRRVLRLLVLVLEEPPRSGALARALFEVREVEPQVAACAADPLGRSLRELLAPALAVGVDAATAVAPLRAGAPAVLAASSEVLRLLNPRYTAS
jgi:hypothetical protein